MGIGILVSVNSSMHSLSCQYGCPKKRWDLSKKANQSKGFTKEVLDLKCQIYYFKIFPLYYFEFPLYA